MHPSKSATQDHSGTSFACSDFFMQKGHVHVGYSVAGALKKAFGSLPAFFGSTFGTESPYCPKKFNQPCSQITGSFFKICKLIKKRAAVGLPFRRYAKALSIAAPPPSRRFAAPGYTFKIYPMLRTPFLFQVFKHTGEHGSRLCSCRVFIRRKAAVGIALHKQVCGRPAYCVPRIAGNEAAVSIGRIPV